MIVSETIASEILGIFCNTCCPIPGELQALLVFFVALPPQFMTVNSSFDYFGLNWVIVCFCSRTKIEFMTLMGLGGRPLTSISDLNNIN